MRTRGKDDKILSIVGDISERPVIESSYGGGDEEGSDMQVDIVVSSGSYRKKDRAVSSSSYCFK